MAEVGRAVVAHGQDFDVREYPVPDPGPETVLLRQELTGICATDVHMWQNGIEPELLMGHEFVGIIAAMGADVTADALGNPVHEGDRVIVVPGGKYGGYGFQSNPDRAPHFLGGFADYIHLIHPETCFIKTAASPELAVLAEPFTIGVHAVMRAEVEMGDTVVVQGSGPIGLMTLVCAKLSGAAKLIVVGGPAERLELASRMGADVVIDIADVTSVEERTELVKSNTTKQAGADVVFECAGYLPAIPEGLGYTKFSGTFCEVGHFVDVGTIEFNPNTMLMRRNLHVEAIWGSRADHFLRGVPILEKDEFPFSEMLSHVLPLSRVKDGFQALDGTYKLGDETVIKIAVGSQAA